MHLRHSLRKLELVLHDFGVFEVLAASFMPLLPQTTLGSLRNDDDEGNENAKKPTGLDITGKTTTLHVHHAFSYISLPSLHDYNVKFHVLLRTGTKVNNFFFLFLNFDKSFRMQLQNNLPTHDELNEME